MIKNDLTIQHPLPLAAEGKGDEPSALIPEHWLPWVRAGWGIVAFICLWTFGATLVQTYQFANDLPQRIALGLAALGWGQAAYFWFTVATIAPLFVVCFVMGTAIYWLRPHERMALFTSVFLMSYGAASSFTPAPEYLAVIAKAPAVFVMPVFITGMLSYGLLAVFFATFPDGKFVPKWMVWIALEGLLFTLAWELFPEKVGDFSGPLGMIALPAALIALGGSMFGQVWRYRNHATLLQKQQTKWFVFGLALNVGILLLQAVVLNRIDISDPKINLLYDYFISTAGLLFIVVPISIGFAILRYRLWDVDILIRKTLVYAVLSALLGLIYFGLVVLLQSVFEVVSGQQSPIAIVISTLVIAALFAPLRRRVQDVIDRRFFRQKYDAQLVLARFAERARDETDMVVLSAELTHVVQETLQPEGLNLWLVTRSGSARPLHKDKHDRK